MNLTVDELIDAIQSARNLERLQTQLRDALIDRFIQGSPQPASANTTIPGAPNL